MNKNRQCEATSLRSIDDFYSLEKSLKKYLTIYRQSRALNGTKQGTTSAKLPDAADRPSVVLVVVVRTWVDVATVEVQVVGVVAVTAIQRTRPIVAVGTLIVDFRTVAVARSGQASGTAICNECRYGDFMQRIGRLF